MFSLVSRKFLAMRKIALYSVRISKGRTIHLVIKEDRSSASGCNHTDFVTGNGKFWFPVALQCSFLFRNPLWPAAIWRDFFQLFLSSILTVFGFRFLLLSVFFHFPFGYGGLRSDQPAFPSPTSISFNLSRCQKIHGISNQKSRQLSLKRTGLNWNCDVINCFWIHISQ